MSKITTQSVLCVAIAICSSHTTNAQLINDSFARHGAQEQVRWRHESNGVRGLILAPTQFNSSRRCLVIFATPNGNTVEQTLGCKKTEQVDWRYDIQHVAAQMRWLREHDSSKDYVLAVVQASQLSWPEFRRTTQDANQWIAGFVESMRSEVSATEVVLACHSGGGSFLWGWINAHDRIPNFVSRFLFLDANYSYSIDDGHDRKLVQWLNDGDGHSLIVVAYDDREIELNGKKVIGEDGGTFRATERMQQSLAKSFSLMEFTYGNFHIHKGLDGRIQLLVHQNPENKILHTALVGEMNGFAVGMILGKKDMRALVRLAEPRSYDQWIPEEPLRDPRISSAKIDVVEERQLELPQRPEDAETGTQFCERVAKLDRKERELEAIKSILAGNVPNISRGMVGIRVTTAGKENQFHHATYHVMRDYMAIGSDTDYVRMPLNPMTGAELCRKLDCEFITDKISDDVYSAAEIRLDPHPLTTDRDQVSAFVAHNQAIENALKGKQSLRLITGIKKDIVVTNRLREKPNRVAIYGWHYRDGRIIQPLYVGHVDWYVDYSHGLRLMSNRMLVDGTPRKVQDILSDSELNGLLSREGTIDLTY